MNGKHEKKGLNTMDKILVVVFLTVVTFIAICLYFYWHDKMISDALIYGFFGLITGECGAMGWIKTTKERRENRRWQLQDQARAEKQAQQQATAQMGVGDTMNY